MPYLIDEDDEVIQAYIAKYRLDDEEVPQEHRKKILRLVGDARELKRLRFESKAKAMNSYRMLDRRLMELRVFHALEHKGYNDLTDALCESIQEIPKRIAEKF